jgi:CheY-like chemotaxis protein
MKLLFIEDDDLKASTILDFINEDFKMSLQIIRRKSWQSGLLEVIDNYKNYGFILLDMSMPRYDSDIGDVNEEFETYAGWDLLKEMKRKRIHLPVCIITSFDFFGTDENLINHEKLDLILHDDFPEFYQGMIYFNSSYIDWKNKLSKIISKVVYDDADSVNR